jgi:UDP-N-acetylglucosamine acyltransferase
MAVIHPTAVVDPTAKLADDVEIGAYAIVEQDAEIGPGSVIRPHAVIQRYTILGSGNYVDSFAVLGGDPQDLKFSEQEMTRLRVGNDNVFREGVTISRGTGAGSETVVGNRTYWMTNAHAGHNCEIRDNVIAVNGSLLAGHCTVGEGAVLPANGAIHQFCWVGEGSFFQGGAQVSMHVPPYVLCARDNCVMGLNAVGLRRAEGVGPGERKQVREAFRLTYQAGLTLSEALPKMDSFQDWVGIAVKFRTFIREILSAEKPHNRGLCPSRKDRVPH